MDSELLRIFPVRVLVVTVVSSVSLRYRWTLVLRLLIDFVPGREAQPRLAHRLRRVARTMPSTGCAARRPSW
ncbi:MAG: hypothetical protein DWI04_07175 [Planctomycetota bacterium]|nr:MAG: hypothetical protein DWI04_07175 [Planctomycetota bacterium]